jgi:hypothetical protein
VSDLELAFDVGYVDAIPRLPEEHTIRQVRGITIIETGIE